MIAVNITIEHLQPTNWPNEPFQRTRSTKRLGVFRFRVMARGDERGLKHMEKQMNISVAISILSALIAAFSALYVRQSYKEAIQSRKESVQSRDADLLIWIMEVMSNIKKPLKKLKDAGPYGTISSIQTHSFTSPWSADDEDAAQLVSVELERVAYLATSGLLGNKEHLWEMWGPMIADAWLLLETWIWHKRLKNGEAIYLQDGALSRKNFEILAQEFKKRRVQHF